MAVTRFELHHKSSPVIYVGGAVVPGKEGSVLQGSLTVPARGFYTAILIFSLTVGFLVIAGSAWDLVFGTHQLRR